MKKFRKILFSLIMVFVVAFSFTACGKNNNNSDNPNSSETEQGTGGNQGGNNTGSNDNQGSGENSDGNQDEEEPNVRTETTISVDQFLSEAKKLNISLTNSYKASLTQTLTSGEVNEYNQLVSVSSKTESDGRVVDVLLTSLAKNDVIISYMSESVMLNPDYTNFIGGLIIDEENKLYYYIEDYAQVDTEELTFETYADFCLMQNAIVCYNNNLIYNGKFIDNFISVFSSYINDMLITKVAFNKQVTYTFEFKNEYSKDSKYILDFENKNLNYIEIYNERANETISLHISPSSENIVIEIPEIIDKLYFYEKLPEENN